MAAPGGARWPRDVEAPGTSAAKADDSNLQRVELLGNRRTRAFWRRRLQLCRATSDECGKAWREAPSFVLAAENGKDRPRLVR